MAEERSERPAQATDRPERRDVAVGLIETTPDRGGLFHWILASPLIGFLGWMWVDLFAHYSPISFYWLDVALALVAYGLVVVLPLGLAAHWFVTALPAVFGRAGWDVQYLEPVREAEQYLIRYRVRHRTRASSTWPRRWVRAAQGWVYLEIAVILAGGVLIIPIFFSASEFGFGR